MYPSPTETTSTPLQEAIILETRNMSKVFPGTLALDQVNFQLYRGKVNVLVGENGAGKSTLMNILAGVHQPTDGEILLDGKKVDLKSPADAIKHGIGIIHQELNLFPNMRVVDNIFAGREIRNQFGGVDYQKEEEIARRLISRLEEAIDPKTLVGDLRVGQQQLVEIAKALAENVRILIMDEPTSALSIREVDVLFRVIRELLAQGVSIVYISHKLEELLQIAEYITVLRDGKVVVSKRAENIDVNWIIEKMVGRRQDAFYIHVEHEITDTLLEVKNLKLRHPTLSNRFLVDDVSFDLHSGEILGIYGLMGAGRTELLECLMGRHTDAKGSILLDKKGIAAQTIGRRIKQGLALVPEDRQRDGVVQTLSTAKNMTLANLRTYFKGISLSYSAEQSGVKKMINDLSIVVADPEQLIISLSGGNQQKVIVARALLTSPKVLLLDEPTRGIDVGAKQEIFKLVSNLAAEGYGIIFVSSELGEVLAMSDRILVMCKGKITREFSRHEATEEKLVSASAV
jgi:erythritol transport system ATP-binding protein